MSFITRLKKFLNWSSSTKPEINLNTELYEQLKPFRLPLICVVLMMTVGSLGYVFIDNFSLIDGIYQAGMTFTTVGFTEVAPISTKGRLFTITFILLGFVVFTFSIGILVEVLKKGLLIGILKERNMLYKIARLKNHFIICYHNIYTIELSAQFRENHIPFVVVDNRDDLAELAEEHKYPYFIKAQPHTQTAFLKTHLSSAKGLITLSPNIADNIALIASVRLYEKEIGRKRPFFVMTNSDNEDDTERLKKLGANSVVSPSRLVAQRLSAMSVRPDMENMLEQFLYKKDSPIDIEEILVPDYSWVRFKRLKETHLRNITNADVVGIRDMNNKFIPMPNGDTLIGTGTKLLVIGTVDGIRLTKRVIKSKHKPEEFKYV
ncbi:potassium channel protein [Campylobacter sp. RM9344]|uniref:Potassium channel protein n=1 Tax=Campylobacter californiensis TaxID=1032243 RepID=A0AAW3ZVA9_9BACT|nr:MULTISPECIES: potassium channel protein [unclassified Campylobacter]MBE2983928.1 potassium channel protein [Campylobacter sp. RM6883]MBE2986090.1 potassium channel protein [Campylobacter sp. RM12919]MBE2987503.1 potassium channel protein [Campylobacter sp. RM12920]MBE2994466.1 potassium channel protein [Campylobacter sp. RM6913]MBE3022460.1 potassium channel protein [Campylobacter sp. 7477a]MBE3028774.1 potassium channel protein [Campylobacter sp. RM9344]